MHITYQAKPIDVQLNKDFYKASCPTADLDNRSALLPGIKPQKTPSAAHGPTSHHPNPVNDDPNIPEPPNRANPSQAYNGNSDNSLSLDPRKQHQRTPTPKDTADLPTALHFGPNTIIRSESHQAMTPSGMRPICHNIASTASHLTNNLVRVD